MTQIAKYGRSSLARIGTCHPDMIRVLMEAERISPIDLTVIEGLRAQARQRALYAQGRTEPGRIVTQIDGVSRRSKHQAVSKVSGEPVSDDHPDAVSLAVDIGPHPLDWNDAFGFGVVYAVMMQAAVNVGVRIRGGADWDGDGDRADQRFDDYPHFELVTV